MIPCGGPVRSPQTWTNGKEDMWGSWEDVPPLFFPPTDPSEVQFVLAEQTHLPRDLPWLLAVEQWPTW